MLRWTRVGLGVALVLGALLIEPQLGRWHLTGAPIVIAAVVVGYIVRRSFVDAALFGFAHMACGVWVEPLAGPQLLACVTSLMLLWAGRPKLSLVMGGTVVGLLLISTHIKMRFGGSALTWQDLRYFFSHFPDNAAVIASQPTVLSYAVAAGIAIGAATALVWKLEARAVLAQAARKERSGARALALLFAVWCGLSLEATAVSFSERGSWQMEAATTATPVSTFLSTIHLEPRAEFRRVNTRQLAEGVRAAAGAASPGRKADIVVFLQESQFNPLSIAGCPRSLCGLKVFEAMPGTTDRGELRVHTYGGGTWLSEFTLATGLPHEVFGRTADYVSFNVAPAVNRSFVRSLKAAGYYTVAVYPVRGGMMNARLAYQAYGFDEFHDSNDLQLPGHFATRDADIHEAAIRVLHEAQRKGKPVYLLALTIFNHSQHGVLMERVPRGTLSAAREVFHDEAEAQSLADYLWRTREFEESYDKTRQQVLGSDRPAVLAWFGDHQPPFANAPLLRNSIGTLSQGPAVPSRFLTWYNISTNFRSNANGEKPYRVDLAFLPGLLAQRARVPLDDWLGANVLVRERCSGLFTECTDPSWRDAYLTYLLDDLRVIR